MIRQLASVVILIAALAGNGTDGAPLTGDSQSPAPEVSALTFDVSTDAGPISDVEPMEIRCCAYEGLCFTTGHPNGCPTGTQQVTCPCMDIE
ncbi:MAG: hypothetical protein ACE5EX_02005 [Phycisphaerae bacterium]